MSTETDTETENFRSLDDSEQQQLNVDQAVFIIFRTNNKEQEMMGITQNVEYHFVENHQVDQKIFSTK